MRSSAAWAFGNCEAGGGEAQPTANAVSSADSSGTLATQGVQQIEIRVRQRQGGRKQTDLVLFTQLGQTQAVDHGDRTRPSSRGFFARAAQYLTRSHD